MVSMKKKKANFWIISKSQLMSYILAQEISSYRLILFLLCFNEFYSWLLTLMWHYFYILFFLLFE